MTSKKLNSAHKMPDPVQPRSGSQASQVHENLKETLVPKLDTMRYMEMKALFNNKPYDEGIVRTENHARTFLYFSDFSLLADEEIVRYLQQLEKDYPNLKGSVYLRTHEGKKFISLEPLFPDSGEKEIAQKLADEMKALLEQKDKNLTSEL